MTINPILTTLNAPLTIDYLYDAQGNRTLFSTLSGIPLGTAGNSQDSELAVKVVIVGNRSDTDASGQVSPRFHAMGASATYSIPIGAKGWTVSYFTGTGTVGGVAVPAGFSDSDSGTLASAIVVTTDSGSSAYVRYNL